MKVCPFCTKTVRSLAVRCTHCDADLSIDRPTVPPEGKSLIFPTLSGRKKGLAFLIPLVAVFSAGWAFILDGRISLLAVGALAVYPTSLYIVCRLVGRSASFARTTITQDTEWHFALLVDLIVALTYVFLVGGLLYVHLPSTQ